MRETFRGRFVLVTTLVAGLLIVVSGSLVFLAYRNALMDSLDRSLIAAAREGAAGREPANPTITVEYLKIVNDQFYQVMSRQGKVTIAYLDSAHPWPMNKGVVRRALAGDSGFESVEHKSEKFRLLYYPVDADTVLRLRTSQEGVELSLAELKKLLIFSITPMISVVALLGWIYSGRLLRFVDDVRQFASRIKEGQWDKRLTMDAYGSEVKELGAILNDVVENVKRSLEFQKRFTADVSHEIRSPLTSLRGNIEVALRKKRTAEEYEDLLKNNLSDVIRLSRLMDNLLFLSRADHKILALRRQWFDVKHALERIVEGFAQRAQAAGIALAGDFQEDVELNGDIELLEQAWSNVIDNAIKYTPRGGSVSVQSRATDGSVTITVRDTGIGIPEDQTPRIFERFYRVERNRSRRLGGTGLGLAITHWIVKAHGGDISVESVPDKGSAFTITLPKATEIGI